MNLSTELIVTAALGLFVSGLWSTRFLNNLFGDRSVASKPRVYSNRLLSALLGVGVIGMVATLYVVKPLWLPFLVVTGIVLVIDLVNLIRFEFENWDSRGP